MKENQEKKTYVKVGGGWTKKDKLGNKFINIRLDLKDDSSVWFTAHANKYKETDKHPDVNISMSTDDADKFGLKYFVKTQDLTEKPHNKGKEKEKEPALPEMPEPPVDDEDEEIIPF